MAPQAWSGLLLVLVVFTGTVTSQGERPGGPGEGPASGGVSEMCTNLDTLSNKLTDTHVQTCASQLAPLVILSPAADKCEAYRGAVKCLLEQIGGVENVDVCVDAVIRTVLGSAKTFEDIILRRAGLSVAVPVEDLRECASSGPDGGDRGDGGNNVTVPAICEDIAALMSNDGGKLDACKSSFASLASETPEEQCRALHAGMNCVVDAKVDRSSLFVCVGTAMRELIWKPEALTALKTALAALDIVPSSKFDIKACQQKGEEDGSNMEVPEICKEITTVMSNTDNKLDECIGAFESMTKDDAKIEDQCSAASAGFMCIARVRGGDKAMACVRSIMMLAETESEAMEKAFVDLGIQVSQNFDHTKCEGEGDGSDMEVPEICKEISTVMSNKDQKLDDCVKEFESMTKDDAKIEEQCNAAIEGFTCIARVRGGDKAMACVRSILMLAEKDPDAMEKAFVDLGVQVSENFDHEKCGEPEIDDKDEGLGCSNVTVVVPRAAGYTDCQLSFATIMVENVRLQTAQCENLQKGLTCLAGHLRKDNPNKCYNEMINTLQESPIDLLNAINAMGISTSEMTFDVSKCTLKKKEDDGKGGNNGRPDNRPPSGPSVPTSLKSCRDTDAIKTAMTKCGGPDTATPTEASCSDLHSMVECVMENVLPKNNEDDDFAKRQCMAAVREIIEKYGSRLTDKKLPRASNCSERENVCGDGDKPSDRTCKKDSDCGADFMCKRQYCCPQKKDGKCPPKPRGIPTCGKKCTKDSECQGHEKCCNQGCGGMTCVKLESPEEDEMGSCDKELKKAGEQLMEKGICGLGTRTLKVPKCMANSKSSPVLDVINGKPACANSEGKKVNGSEFAGNRDCTDTKPAKKGRCPATTCQHDPDAKGTCKQDHDCSGDQKCCMKDFPNAGCLKTCLDAEEGEEPEAIQDDCPNRVCCPVTLCQGRICLGNPGAVCRMNTCGDCKIEFFDAQGNMVDCDKDVTVCQKKREEARLKNTEHLKSDKEKLEGMMKARMSGKHRDNDDDDDDDKIDELRPEMSGDDRDDRRKDMGKDECRMVREMFDGDDKMMDRERDYDDDEDMDRDDSREEGGMMGGDRDGMGGDRDGMGGDRDGMGGDRDGMGGDSEGMDDNKDDDDDSEEKAREDREPKEAESKKIASMKMCEFINRLQLCKNSGACALSDETRTSPLQICKCQTGYYGLFCEKQGSAPATQCLMDQERTATMQTALMKTDEEAGILHRLIMMMRLPHGVLPMFSCDQQNQYNTEQMGYMLSVKKPLKYCVDPSTGQRIPHSPVKIYPSKEQAALGTLDCTLTSKVDFFRLPKVCWASKQADCEAGKKCEYFFNNNNRMCEKGAAGHGFTSLTACYDQCGHAKTCPTIADGTVGICAFACNATSCMDGKKCCPTACGGSSCMELETLTPAPCAGEECVYKSEFCHVTEDPVTMQISGMCQAFSEHCLLPADPGYGEEAMAMAYYYNATMRMCMPFRYTGHGGNANRFCSMKQCHAECGPRPRKFSDVSCPRMLKADMKDQIVNGCSEDANCKEDKICCLAGGIKEGGICTDAVQICSSGARCSRLGVCESDGRCNCTNCTGVPEAKVCGSDGMTYPSACELTRKACVSMRNVTKKHDGECTAADKPGMKCPEMCTEDYKPVCVYDTTVEGQNQAVTKGNLCKVMMDVCNGKKLNIIKHGECDAPSSCGPSQLTCEIYKDCIDGACGCMDVCTAEYKPICGAQLGSQEEKTFSSPCDMRRRGCQDEVIYTFLRPGPCKEKAMPKFECPEIDATIPNSAVQECNVHTHEQCDNMTERCCPHGEGTACVPMQRLVKKEMKKDGICPSRLTMPMSEDSECVECESDDECEGDAKCCQNDNCGSTMTCSGAIKLEELKVCGTGYHVLKDLTCNAETSGMACPGSAVCTPAGEISVCCISNNAADPSEDEIQKSVVCSFFEMIGKPCMNGGTCMGKVGDGDLCACTDGYYGPFCEHKVAAACGTPTTNCVDSPCRMQSCPAQPEATCRDNYCVGCDYNYVLPDGTDVTDQCDTPCTKVKGIFREVFKKLGLRNSTDDVKPPEPATALMLMSLKDSPFVDRLMEMLKRVKLDHVPFMGEVRCKRDGTFDEKQCMHDPKSGAGVCMCKMGDHVDKRQIRRSTKELDCSTVQPDFPKFCLQQPSGSSECRTDTTNQRFYFDSMSQECVEFTDYGCDAMMRNNFQDKETCMSTCSSALSSNEACGDKCEDNQRCRIKDGNPVCEDIPKPKGGAGVFQPICDKDGLFEAKQCHGDVCRCVNRNTGDAIPDSDDLAQNLQCKEEGSNVEAVKSGKGHSGCDGRSPKFCENGGDSCNNCAETDEVRRRKKKEEDSKSADVNARGTCKSCDECPNNQKRQVCRSTECKAESFCKFNENATCFIDTCDCKEVWEFNDEPVKCNEAKSLCARRKEAAEAEKKRNEKAGNTDYVPTEIVCTEDGKHFKAECKGDDCSCVKALTGDAAKNANKAKGKDNLDCGKEQAARLKATIKSRLKMKKDKNPSDLSTKQRTDYLRTGNDTITRTMKNLELEARVKTHQLVKGSIVYEYELEDPGVGTVDIVTAALMINQEVNDGNVKLNLDGVEVTATDGEILEVTEVDEQETGGEELDDDDDDDNKKTIIIVVVVVVVVLILAVVIGCVCMKKSKKAKSTELPFTDIHGQSNPGYAYNHETKKH